MKLVSSLVKRFMKDEGRTKIESKGVPKSFTASLSPEGNEHTIRRTHSFAVIPM
jgi:hypothetical protein